MGAVRTPAGIPGQAGRNSFLPLKWNNLVDAQFRQSLAYRGRDKLLDLCSCAAVVMRWCSSNQIVDRGAEGVNVIQHRGFGALDLLRAAMSHGRIDWKL